MVANAITEHSWNVKPETWDKAIVLLRGASALFSDHFEDQSVTQSNRLILEPEGTEVSASDTTQVVIADHSNGSTNGAMVYDRPSAITDMVPISTSESNATKTSRKHCSIKD